MTGDRPGAKWRTRGFASTQRGHTRQWGELVSTDPTILEAFHDFKIISDKRAPLKGDILMAVNVLAPCRVRSQVPPWLPSAQGPGRGPTPWFIEQPGGTGVGVGLPFCVDFSRGRPGAPACSWSGEEGRGTPGGAEPRHHPRSWARLSSAGLRTLLCPSGAGSLGRVLGSPSSQPKD